MAPTYYGILTAVGEAKDANAKALGIPLVYAEMAVGDGNGVIPVPDRNRTSLVRQVRRAPLNSLSRDAINLNQVIAEQVIPESVGGWYIRELGLYDADGDLIAIANCPETYKPLLAEGSGRVQTVRMVIIVASADNVQLKIDPAIVLATRDYADKKAIEVIIAHEAQAHPHPQYFKSRADVLPGGLAKQILRKKSVATDDWEWADVEESVMLKSLIPKDKTQSVIYVSGIGLMEWVDITGTGAFSGYRCPEVGRIEYGSTVAPRGYELDMLGGLVSKTAYASLWAWAQQNGHSVTASAWTVRSFKFADVDANNFRLPDLRDVFVRFTGTNADTVVARAIGSYQDQQLASHSHPLKTSNAANGVAAASVRASSSGDDAVSTLAAGGTETRPINIAFAPRIHI